MIEKIKNLIIKYKQFLLFFIVGASNTLITMAVLCVLTKLKVYVPIASTIGYICGIINGYIWSSKIVFKKKKTVDNAIKFAIVNLLAIGINFLMMLVWTSVLSINEMIAQAITIIFFTMPLNFILNKIWTYRSKES